MGDAAEVAAWGGVFSCGYDFFGDLEPFGFPGGDSCRAARAAAPDVWRRLGKSWLESGAHKAHGQPETPWALEQFGYPEGYINAR
ncbi:hypothetical protein JQ609_04265 [Bradyrhizobium sp. AUGA SZCCT0169]|uniref:hypothetical protein n=1 Tax=Bradyrhizobium sp. AUGA SZCCT0169 TaxID=2807663 RepID=UPI001BA89C76|nr:hypothetical protein [Bradyrhizobium sp. AUGA SZCCT0169]MBR1246143.1 hypothetical protein [Bradyrhizobium sp. AUGA SZCCT0169]